MAPYKLEDNMRDKLEARELKPSANAWKKLEARLDAEQPKTKPILWYYAAASIVGILILVSIFYSRNNFEGNNTIVNENIHPPNPETNSEIIPINVESQKIASELPVTSEEEYNVNKDNTKSSGREANETAREKSIQLKNPSPKKSEIDKKIQQYERVAQTKNENVKPNKEEKAIISEDEKHINLKIDEVVASVKKLQEDNADVTAAEVEALLDNARREIQSQRILNNPKVDATALLQDVEWELEKSFRDKVFDALGEGFNKIRTAVSERND
ncbi:hypothetical protein [Aequorivita flava]|uniref:Anti-sigma factor n=1 Tax=Aequorivita flava TaxID=3114371 RepID=A0AB35YTL6_9FLAO